MLRTALTGISPELDSALASLPDSALESAATALTAATNEAFGPALTKLDAWLEGRALDDALLADYVRDLVDNGHSLNTATKTVAAVRRRAKFAGTKCPAGPRTREMLSRIGVYGVRKPHTIGWMDLASAVPRIEGESLRGCRDAAMIALGCEVDLSVAEMSALDVADLFRGDDGQWRIRIRGSGPDRNGEAAILDNATVRRVRTWLNKADITSGPMFPLMGGYGRDRDRRMTERGIRHLATGRARAAGIFDASRRVLAMGRSRAMP